MFVNLNAIFYVTQNDFVFVSNVYLILLLFLRQFIVSEPFVHVQLEKYGT